MSTNWRSYLSLITFSAVMVMGPYVSKANSIQGNCNQWSNSPVVNGTQAELATFMEATVKSQMQTFDIPGLTISIVKDNQIIFSRGFGMADLEIQRQVNPNSTLFRIGSISKTFTWVAVMQLVEAGKIDLNKSVNTYLTKFKIHETFAEPITMAHLMTHSGGFEDGFAGYLFQKNPDDVMNLEEWLRKYMPETIRPPGNLVSYSNYGSALAGYIVQEVSGERFNDYIETHILSPLGMENTSFREPLGTAHPDNIDATLAERFSTGYIRRNGRNKPFHFEYATSVAPAGSASTTASDMARYMLSLLPANEDKCDRILTNETLEKMQKRQMANTQELSGMAHGFIHTEIGGHEVFTHTGGTSSFYSNLVLIPELRLGIFLSMNSTTSREPIERIPELLINHFYPANKPELFSQPAVDFVKQGERFVGDYLTTRRSYTKLEKILSLISGNIQVRIDPDGYLLMTSNGLTNSWVEIAPRVFRQVGGDKTRIFDEDINGNITRLHPQKAVFAYDRVSFLQSPSFVFLSLICLGLFSLTTLADNWYCRDSAIKKSGMILWPKRIASITAITGLVLIVMIVFALGAISKLGHEIAYNWPPKTLFVVLWLILLLTGLTLALATSLFPIWHKNYSYSIWRKLHHTMFSLSCFAFVVASYEWNLIGFKFY